MIKRFSENIIKSQLFKGKAIIILGARQVGKTTLVENILNEYKSDGRYLNCEILSVEQNLKVAEPDKLKTYFGNYKLIVLDEAQNIPGIGRILKIIVDTLKDIQIIATGSYSFELAEKISEPMTGRVIHIPLFPLSVLEIINENDWLTFDSKLEKLLRYGLYPEIFLSDERNAKMKLAEISSSYLFKDLLLFDGIKKSELIKNLVIALAFQVGNEVTYNELSNKLGVSSLTIQKYIDLLEKAFVVFKLNSFSRNMRKEITKSFKIYFYDVGIRNAIINNFNTLGLRNDIGALWENFCIVERMKSNTLMNKKVNNYFWRTYDQKEVDYVEEADGKLTGFEFKFSERAKSKPPKLFTETYDAEIVTVSPSNFWKFASLKI